MTKRQKVQFSGEDGLGLPKIGRRIRSFHREKRGVAAIEFGLIAPFMIFLWVGSFEISEAVSVDRKVSHAASVLADLVTQQTNLTSGEMGDIMDATLAIMAPFDVGNLTVEVAGVRIDGDKATEVVWSETRAGTNAPVATGGTPTIPEPLLIPDTFLIVANLSYKHTPTVSHSIEVTSFELSDAFFLRPRRSEEITYNQ